MELIVKRLKSLTEILNAGGWFSSGDEYWNTEKGQTINDDMIQFFGNGKSYRFIKLYNCRYYTHDMLDNGHWSFHEDWFADEAKLDDEIWDI